MWRWLKQFFKPSPSVERVYEIHRLRDDGDHNTDTEWLQLNRGRLVVITDREQAPDGTVYCSGFFSSEAFEPFQGLRESRFSYVGRADANVRS